MNRNNTELDRLIFDLKSPDKENTPVSSGKKRKDSSKKRGREGESLSSDRPKHRPKNLFGPMNPDERVEPIQNVGFVPLRSAAPIVQPPNSLRLNAGDFEQFLEEVELVEGPDMDENELELELDEDFQEISITPTQIVQQEQVATASPAPQQPVAQQPQIAAPAPQAPIVPANWLLPLRIVNGYECPQFLQQLNMREHRIVFEILHQQGGHFLCKRGSQNIHWSEYPTHDKVYIQPYDEAQNQLHFSSSPRDIVYHGTYVTAIIRDRHDVCYPVHLITKNTLGATKNVQSYPKRIRDLFNGNWAANLARECLIIKVDKYEHKQQITRDYEQLVNQLGNRAIQALPNLRVFYKDPVTQQHRLTKMFTPENCGQQNLLAYGFQVAPDPSTFLLQLRELRRTEIQNIRALFPANQSAQEFEQACAPFFQPNHLTCAMALTQFTLNEMRQFRQLVEQSRTAIINVKRSLVNKYGNSADFKHQNVIDVLGHLDQVRNKRTSMIQTVERLADRYESYMRDLSGLLGCTYQAHNIESTENVLYAELNKHIYHINPDVNLKNHFNSGRELVAWMVTNDIEIPEHHRDIAHCRAEVANNICEILPAPRVELGY